MISIGVALWLTAAGGCDLDVAALEKRCKARKADACLKLADAYVTQACAPPTPDAAKARYQSACKLSDADGCAALALKFDDAASAKKAVKLYEKRCKRKDVEACISLGKDLLEHSGGFSGIKEDPHRWFREALAHSNDPLHALDIATALDATSSADYRAWAESLREDACRRGVARACAAIADKLVGGNAPKAYGYYAKACDDGEPRACVEAGGLLERKAAQDPDAARPRALYLKGCAVKAPALHDDARRACEAITAWDQRKQQAATAPKP